MTRSAPGLTSAQPDAGQVRAAALIAEHGARGGAYTVNCLTRGCRLNDLPADEMLV
jgi:hypothetical protein